MFRKKVPPRPDDPRGPAFRRGRRRARPRGSALLRFFALIGVIAVLFLLMRYAVIPLLVVLNPS